ncbi:hypothetical protein MNV49_004274 [Pseudohyphozyma bogoriensis]|nr:hypothetical protein MNV49_004274 [Pseudohyphozyma bogoriensis]
MGTPSPELRSSETRKVPAPLSGFVTLNQHHRRRSSLPCTPPETPADFTFFPTKHVVHHYQAPLSPPVTPTRPTRLGEKEKAEDYLPSYNAPRKTSIAAGLGHRRMSTQQALVYLAQRPLLTPTKVITLFCLVFSVTLLASFVPMPSPLALFRPSASPAVAPPPHYRAPTAVLEELMAGKKAAGEREAVPREWAQPYPLRGAPEKLNVDRAREVDAAALDDDVIRQHPEAYTRDLPPTRQRRPAAGKARIANQRLVAQEVEKPPVKAWKAAEPRGGSAEEVDNDKVAGIAVGRPRHGNHHHHQAGRLEKLRALNRAAVEERLKQVQHANAHNRALPKAVDPEASTSNGGAPAPDPRDGKRKPMKIPAGSALTPAQVVIGDSITPPELKEEARAIKAELEEAHAVKSETKRQGTRQSKARVVEEEEAEVEAAEAGQESGSSGDKDDEDSWAPLAGDEDEGDEA